MEEVDEQSEQKTKCEEVLKEIQKKMEEEMEEKIEIEQRRKRPMERIRKILKLDDKIMPLGLLLIGYPDEEKEERSQYEEQKVHIYE